jgi:hypothetical protein
VLKSDHWVDDPKYTLEEEQRKFIPSLNRDVPKRLLDALAHLYPGYELLYRGDCRAWLLYKVKYRGGCPADDTLFKQFVLPDYPDMWLINLMQQLDRGNMSFKEWNENRKRIEELEENRRKKRRQDLTSDMLSEIHAYQTRGKETFTVNG